jgi:hypothetical protein
MQNVITPPEPTAQIAPAAPASVNQAAAPTVVRSNPFAMLVVLCGIASTALTLIGVYILDRLWPDFNVMGWYANQILPIGAMLVGVAASAGYGIAAWVGGLKFSKKLLWTILALQACAYFAAQYIEFASLHLVHRANNTPVGFLEYYDLTARSFAWKQHDGSAGEPLGVFGYFFRLLEFIGFAAAGLFVPVVMRSNPYCDKCVRYMRTKQLGYVPASIKLKNISKKDVAANEAQAAELQKAMDAGKQRVEALQALASNSKVDGFTSELAALKMENKKSPSLPIRYVVELIHCPSCRAGHMKIGLLTGRGNHVQRKEVSTTRLHEDFVQLIRNQ